MTTNIAHDYIITPELDQAGLVSYWRVAEGGISLQTLRTAWAKQGLDEALLPSPPDSLTALGRAVADLAERRILVRPLARRGAWMIVKETVLEDNSLAYRQLVRVSMNSDVLLPQVDAEEADEGERRWLHAQVTARFQSHEGMLVSNDITSWLVSIVKKHASAVSLRDTGGVYFIPRDKIDFWRKVKGAVEATAGYNVFVIPAMKNAEAVAAITDAMTKEANDIVAKIQDELSKTGDEALGKRAVTSREEIVAALLAKLGEYEGLLGRQLGVRERITDLSATLSILALTQGEGE